jgi:hypothetical protein
MDTDAHGLETNLTETVIDSAFEVSKVWGAGFLEKLYGCSASEFPKSNACYPAPA